MFKKLNIILGVLIGFLLFSWSVFGKKEEKKELLHVSFDTTREIFQKINAEFFQKTGIRVWQSHGGSSKQAGYVTAGLRADVVSLALTSDIENISKKGFIDKSWEKRQTNSASPFYSVIAMLVRKGNPKKITNWSDLIREDVELITPNPKTSGGGKWNFLALYGYAKNESGENQEKILFFLKKVYSHVPVMDTGARGSVATFLKRNIGDVLLIWENEAFLAMQESNGELEIIYPPITILAEPKVSLVDRTTNLNQSQEMANQYLEFFYSDFAQETFAVHGFRPYKTEILDKYRNKFPDVETFRATDIFSDWNTIQKEVFANGKLADEVFR